MAITVSVSGLNAVYKGISTLKLHDVTNNILYNWSTPLSASLETNIETRDITSRDKTGKMSRVNVVETGAMPVLNLSYSSWKAPKFTLPIVFLVNSLLTLSKNASATYVADI